MLYESYFQKINGVSYWTELKKTLDIHSLQILIMIFMFVKTVHHPQQLRLRQLQPLRRLHRCQISVQDMVKSVQGEFAIVMSGMKVTNVTLKTVKISWQDQTVDSGKFSIFCRVNWFLFCSECKLDSYTKKMYCAPKPTLPPLNPPTQRPVQTTTTRPWTISTAPNQCKL